MAKRRDSGKNTAAAEMARLRWAKTSPEERRELASRAGKAMWRYPFVAACVSLYSVAFLRVLTLRADEGLNLSNAARVYHGQLPYRDFFEVVGPATFYWLALFFRLFGETWLATRLSVLAVTIATALLLYFLAHRLKPGSEILPLILWFATSFPEWATVSHHLIANLFALTAFAIVMWDDSPRGMFFFGGISAGASLITMLPEGLLLCVALAAILAIQRRIAAVVQLLTGAAAFLLACAAYFWARGGLADMYQTTVVWPAAHYSGINAVPYGFGLIEYCLKIFAALAAVFDPAMAFAIAAPLCAPLLVIFLLPVILLALGLYLNRAAFTAKTIPYWITGAALWLSQMHRPDMIHLVFGSPVLLVLLSSLVHQKQGRLLMAAGAIPATMNLLMCMTAPEAVSTPVGRVRLFASNPIIAFTNSHVRPGESLFVYPFAPTYYFLAKASNPTGFSSLLYGHHTPEQMRDAIAALETDRTRYVIWDTTFERGFARSALPRYRPPPESERIVEPYLESHYVEIGRERDVRFMERRKP